MAELPVVRDYVLYDNRIADRRVGSIDTRPEKFLGGQIDGTLRALVRYRAHSRARSRDGLLR